MAERVARPSGREHGRRRGNHESSFHLTPCPPRRLPWRPCGQPSPRETRVQHPVVIRDRAGFHPLRHVCAELAEPATQSSPQGEGEGRTQRRLGIGHPSIHHCGGKAESVDYVRALVDGGEPLDESNAVASCLTCNFRRGAEITNRGSVGGDLALEQSGAAHQTR